MHINLRKFLSISHVYYIVQLREPLNTRKSKSQIHSQCNERRINNKNQKRMIRNISRWVDEIRLFFQHSFTLNG